MENDGDGGERGGGRRFFSEKKPSQNFFQTLILRTREFNLVFQNFFDLNISENSLI